jgi:hypothetical protein
VVPDSCSEILRLARLNGLAQASPKSCFWESSPEGVVTWSKRAMTRLSTWREH